MVFGDQKQDWDYGDNFGTDKPHSGKFSLKACRVHDASKSGFKLKMCRNRTKKQRQVGDIDYLELVYLVTALVPSDTACLANSPGKSNLTAVWISREVMVDLRNRQIKHHKFIHLLL